MTTLGPVHYAILAGVVIGVALAVWGKLDTHHIRKILIEFNGKPKEDNGHDQ